MSTQLDVLKSVLTIGTQARYWRAKSEAVKLTERLSSVIRAHPTAFQLPRCQSLIGCAFGRELFLYLSSLAAQGQLPQTTADCAVVLERFIRLHHRDLSDASFDLPQDHPIHRVLNKIHSPALRQQRLLAALACSNDLWDTTPVAVKILVNDTVILGCSKEELLHCVTHPKGVCYATSLYR